jgi:hypothetical protein
MNANDAADAGGVERLARRYERTEWVSNLRSEAMWAVTERMEHVLTAASSQWPNSRPTINVTDAGGSYQPGSVATAQREAAASRHRLEDVDFHIGGLTSRSAYVSVEHVNCRVFIKVAGPDESAVIGLVELLREEIAAASVTGHRPLVPNAPAPAIAPPSTVVNAVPTTIETVPLTDTARRWYSRQGVRDALIVALIVAAITAFTVIALAVR